jgi:hypothetical protein
MVLSCHIFAQRTQTPPPSKQTYHNCLARSVRGVFASFEPIFLHASGIRFFRFILHFASTKFYISSLRLIFGMCIHDISIPTFFRRFFQLFNIHRILYFNFTINFWHTHRWKLELDFISLANVSIVSHRPKFIFQINEKVEMFNIHQILYFNLYD